MGPVNSAAINQYEQVVTQTLTGIAQQIPTASSSNRGIDYITNTRELLNRIKQLADSGLSQLQRLDAQYVKCAQLGKPYEGINIDQALAGVATHAADQAKLPTVLGNLLTSYVDDLEFQRTHTTIQEVLGSNQAAIAAREKRKAAIEAVLTAIKDIRNGRKPEIDQELKKHVIELHSVPGIEAALAGATTAQLDVALTFLQEECHALRALAFPKGAMLVLGHMHKLGTFAHLERLSFSGCNLTDGMVHVLAEKLPSLRTLSIAECKGVTEAAFTTQDAHGRLYAERFRQLTSLRLDSPGRISDLGMIAITTHMRELTDLQLKGCALHNGHMTLIAESLPLLLHLDLSYNPQLTDAAFTARNAHNQTNAAHLSGLLTLDLRGSPLTDQTLLEIAYSMPKLTTLGLPLQAQLVRETAHTVGTKLKNLSELRFAHNDYYRESLRSLSTGLPALFEKAKNIKSLVATGTSSYWELDIIRSLARYLPQLTSLILTEFDLLELFYKTEKGPDYSELLKGLQHLHVLGSHVHGSEASCTAILTHMKQLLSLNIPATNLESRIKEQLEIQFPFAILRST